MRQTVKQWQQNFSDEAKDKQTSRFSDQPWQKSSEQLFQPPNTRLSSRPSFLVWCPLSRRNQWRNYTVHIHRCCITWKPGKAAGACDTSRGICRIPGSWSDLQSPLPETNVIASAKEPRTVFSHYLLPCVSCRAIWFIYFLATAELSLVGIYTATIANHLCTGIYRAPITCSCA